MSSPQSPSPESTSRFAGRPIVVGIVPQQPTVVVRTAVQWAAEIGSATTYFAYVDTSRYVVDEGEDGQVRHADLDPDAADAEGWTERSDALQAELHRTVGDAVAWEFRYLAGRPDHALAHLADAVGASVIIVGTRRSGLREGVRELLDGSVAAELAHSQQRPVLVVPTTTKDEQ